MKPTSKRPPVHAMLMWKAVRTAALQLLIGDPEEPRTWEQAASYFIHCANDPNWQSEPSPIDAAKGRNTAGRNLPKHCARKPKKGPKRRLAIRHAFGCC